MVCSIQNKARHNLRMFRLVEILMVGFKSSASTWLYYPREQRHNIALKIV